MRPRIRKLIGTALLLAFVVFWALFSMSIAEARLPNLSGWGQGALVIFLGLVWVIPAGLIIRWMARPRPE